MPTRKGLAIEDVLDAVVLRRGNCANAARDLGCSPQNVKTRLKTVGITARSRSEVLSLAAAALAKLREGLAADAARATRSARQERPDAVTVAARCHPDRQEYQLGRCRECYRERVERSRATPLPSHAVDPDVLAQLEGLPRAGPPERFPVLGARPVAADEQLAARVIATSPLNMAEFAALEAVARGGTYAAAAEAMGLPNLIVKQTCAAACEKLGVSTIVGAYHALGWLNPNYDETMVRELARLLRRVDAAMHDMILDLDRGAR